MVLRVLERFFEKDYTFISIEIALLGGVASTIMKKRIKFFTDN